MSPFLPRLASHSPVRRRLLTTAASAAAVLATPWGMRAARAQGLTRIVYQTGWLPQPDKGGLYQALATGLYREYGLDVELRSGGPQLNVMQIFLAGAVDFADSDSMRVLSLASQGLPAIAVAAFGQKAFNVVLSHAGSGHDELASLKGDPLLVSTAGRQTYWPWLKAKFGFTDEQIRPYTYSMAPFLVDPRMSMEGFITSEPYELARSGVKPVVHMLAEHGYLAYSNVTLAKPSMVREQPDVVQRFVDATARGWASYLHGDPTPGNALIREGNPDASDEKIAYALETMREHAIFDSPDVQAGGPGAMSHAQWQAIYDSAVQSGVARPGVDIRQGYTLDFVNKRVGA
ncbi:ABC transporter substrate-binding protein [Verticiella sediminum]|uniref:ABC transporter substrate-binding protein n=1 Tax=Verticiella sediminum TaxID=1247510 RepID=A0A556AZP1_9BURK|nr:ABC transporter substrate-binding protein [Verticiella sediminum]TSH98384.1 ABC transporter substrate-binding protein [Verticiella sediminum]